MKRSALAGVLAVIVLGALGAGWAVAHPGGWVAAFASPEPSHRPAGSTSLGDGRALLRAGISRYRSPRDVSAPNTTITKAPLASSPATSAGFTFGSSESRSTFSCKLDGAGWSRCSSPRSYSRLAAGTHTFSVRATDAAGNTDATPATDSWSVTVEAPAIVPAPEPPVVIPAPEPPVVVPPPDTTAPETTIASGPEATTTATAASFAFSASESGSSFACKLDGGAWASCSSPKSYSSLALGAHAFSVRATDAAGNTDATPASQSWTVQAPEPPPDTTAPETQITAGPASSTTATNAVFSFSASEPGSTFACKLDSGSWASCSSSKSYSSLALGAHTFSVRATDAAGNTDASPATQSWTVEAPAPPPDTTAPETTIASGPEATTTATAASFAFSASESGSSFACKLDGGAWASCSSPKSYSSLALGAHAFSVRATDAAGNTDATPASQSWTVNGTEPPPVEPSSCDQTVSSISSAQSALGSAPVGSVVCLANGSYGSLSLSMKRPAPGVTLRAQNPGQATLGSVTASGSGVAVERFNTGSLNVNAGGERIAYRHNSVSGGVYIIGSTSSYAKNVELIGNVIRAATGSGEKDALMIQRFEALRVEENEIWIADEDGSHNDGLQSVWGGRGLIFRGNWMRGGAGSQGFFLKDGVVTNVSFEDNLIAGRPSKAPYAGAPLQVYETQPNAADPFYTGYGMVIRHNTIWSNPNMSYVRECQNKAMLVEFNVMDGWGAPDGTACVLSQLTQDYNVITSGTIGKRGAHDTSTTPSFVDSTNQDWQLTSGSAGNFSTGRAGVTWRPADRTYGP